MLICLYVCHLVICLSLSDMLVTLWCFVFYGRFINCSRKVSFMIWIYDKVHLVSNNYNFIIACCLEDSFNMMLTVISITPPRHNLKKHNAICPAYSFASSLKTLFSNVPRDLQVWAKLFKSVTRDYLGLLTVIKSPQVRYCYGAKRKDNSVISWLTHNYVLSPKYSLQNSYIMLLIYSLLGARCIHFDKVYRLLYVKILALLLLFLNKYRLIIQSYQTVY